MRSSSWPRTLLAVSLVALALAPAALAKGRLDPSFGEGGVVELGKNDVPGAVAVAPGGGIFFTERNYVCGHQCSQNEWLVRYRADGTKVGGRVPGSMFRKLEASLSLAVDSRGRPLLAWNADEGRALVRRLHRGGGIDHTFGRAGTVALPCDCRLESIEALPGGGVLVAASSDLGDIEHYHGTIWYVAELRADGSRDPRFGRDGVVRARMPGRNGPIATLGPKGTVLLTSTNCCDDRFPLRDFVTRLSPAGRLDHAFGAAFKRAVHGVYGTREEDYGWDDVRLMSAGRDGIGLFAGTWESAVAMRFQRDGSRDPTFGKRGVTILPLDYADAASDGSGGMLVVGDRRRSHYQVRRLDPDGRLDRSFGALPLPHAYNEEGLQILPAGRRRALVVARDLQTCRQSCPADPKLFRVRW